MPYVQASPRVRAGYAAPLFSAFAFVVAAGLSLEGSPFCVRPAVARAPLVVDGAPSSRPSCAPLFFDPSLAGVYDTTWGTIALDADGSARGRLHRFGSSARAEDATADDVFNVSGRWHMTQESGVGGSVSMIHFEWGSGSYVAAREWWKPASPRAPEPQQSKH
jgi:hypothetical protein